MGIATYSLQHEKMLAALELMLDQFQWGYPDRGDNRGEFDIDVEHNLLRLTVYTPDNDDTTDGSVKPLVASMPIDDYTEPKDQFRALIHMFLCHEADEQIWIGNTRPFYPH